MGAYIAQRLLLAVPVLFGVSVLVFAAVRLAPGDTAQVIAGPEAKADVVQAIRDEYGLDLPWHEQYVRFVGGLARLDLGRSSVTRAPITEELAERWPVTATLALGATLFACTVGISLGVLAARFQRTKVDYLVMGLAISGLSIPNYVLGLILILVFAVGLGVLPASGAGTPLHYVMPILTVGVVGAGVLARQTRSAILSVLEDDYVRTARAKGLGERPVLFRHALRNALIPVTTIVGIIFGNLLGGTVIVETVFSVNGVGRYMITRIDLRDYSAVQGGVLLIALSFVFVNIVVDLMYAVIDPRVRLK